MNSRLTRFYARLASELRPGFAEAEQRRFDRTAAPAPAADFLASLSKAPLSTQRQVLRSALADLASRS